MSYILEALRRAETERGRRRRVPGLHTQPVPPPGEEPGVARSRVWPWLAVGLGAGVLVPLLWSWWSSEPPLDDTPAARAAATGSVTPQASAVEQAPAAPPPSAAAAEPTEPAEPATPAPERPRHKAPAAKAAVKPEPAVAAVPPPAKPATPSEGANATTAPAATPATATAPANVPEPRLPSLTELPAELQRAVPPLSFGGSVYSDVVAQRMVILNGQVLREGDAVTDELRIEQIRPRSAVMRVRGQRFELAF